MNLKLDMTLRVALTCALTFFLGLSNFEMTRIEAQSATATILGTVTDASGAAVPDAAIQVKNVATGITQSATSDAQGRFRLPELTVGDYEAQSSKTGFSTVVRKGINLAVGSQVVLDFSMQVGQQQQTVTVEGQVAQVETTNAAISTFTSEQQMRELPLNGRNFEQLIQLAPGVTTVTWSTNPLQGRGAQYSVAGGRPEGQAILLDDENLQSYFNNGMSSVTGSSLGVEAIGEFQTLTNAYGAQFGGNGAVINAVTKSGTNAFHGSAFDFIRNNVLDDRNFFSAVSSPPAYRRNQFGGSVGGPVKKDRAFFFVDYEGVRSLLEEEKLATVPNCTGFTSGTCAITATAPATATAIANTLAIYPKPTALIGGGLGTAPTTGSQTNHEDYTLGRFDYTFSEKDSAFVRYYADNVSYLEPYGGAATAIGGGALPYWHELDGGLSEYAVLEERHIISPTLVNVARMSFSRPTKHSNETTIITAADGSNPLQFFHTPGLEDGFVAITGIPGGLGGATAEIFVLNQNTYTWADDILWTRGSHSIRFGASIDRQQSNTYNPISEDSSWSFGSLAGFLSGVAVSVGGVPPQPTNDAHRDFRETMFTPYINDDWKVSSKLTVNLGLRYEFYTNPTEAHNRIYAVTNILTSTAFVNVPNVFKENLSLKDWDPRIGLAYDPFSDHKTAIRAGFGMFHNPVTGLDYQTGYGNTPPWQSLTQTSPTYPFAFTTVNAVIPTSSFGFNYDQSNTTPYVIQYNLNIQREVLKDTILTVGYVGSKGIHQYTGREYNPPTPTVVNGVTYYASCFNATTGVSAYGLTLCPSGSKLTANPRVNSHFGQFEELQPISSSNYNSLQVILNRRFSKSVQAQLSYTYSRCMDDGAFGVGSFIGSSGQTPSSIMDWNNQKIDYSPCSYDIPQVLRVNGLYALPFKGNRAVSGWQISGIASVYGGYPFNVATGFDQLEQVGGVPRPEYLPNNPATSVYPACNNQPMLNKISLWYNPNCYGLEPVGTYGDTGRNTLRGPGFFNMDVLLSKDTKLTEWLNVQFRAEFFNILNHPNFGIPTGSVFTTTGAISSAAGVITSTNQNTNPRQIQFALKFRF